MEMLVRNLRDWFDWLYYLVPHLPSLPLENLRDWFDWL